MSSVPAKPSRRGVRNVVLTGPTSARTASMNSYGPQQACWGDIPHKPPCGVWTLGIPIIPTCIATPSRELLRRNQNAR